VLVYDALSNPELLQWTKPGCEKIHVGKRAKDHALPQEEINALIVEKSKPENPWSGSRVAIR
jgi:uroporphyrinogen III methyltransferase / synthase